MTRSLSFINFAPFAVRLEPPVFGTPVAPMTFISFSVKPKPRLSEASWKLIQAALGSPSAPPRLPEPRHPMPSRVTVTKPEEANDGVKWIFSGQQRGRLG